MLEVNDNEYQGTAHEISEHTYNIEIESDEGDISLVYCDGKAYVEFNNMIACHRSIDFSESDCEECICETLVKDYFFKTTKSARK